MEQVHGLFWDNCKVTYNRSFLWNHIAKLLAQGWDQAKILEVYDHQLHEAHKAATDFALNAGLDAATFKFHCSCLISWTDRHLRDLSQERAERAAYAGRRVRFPPPA